MVEAHTRRLLRDALIVARFDLSESVRSRLFVVTLALYALVSVAASSFFLAALAQVQETVQAQLGVAGIQLDLSEALRENPNFIGLLSGIVGSEELARELVRIPPLALFSCWLGFFCVPLIVILTASDAVASEIASGSCRFALFRTRRLAWALGKVIGQSALMALGLLAGSLAAWLTGLLGSSHFNALATASWMLRLDVRVACYGFCFVGLAVGVSQLTDSPHRARALALFLYIGLAIAGGIVASAWFASHYGAVSQLLVHFFPGKQADRLWQPGLTSRLSAMAMLLALGWGYFFLGYLRFGSRDA